MKKILTFLLVAALALGIAAPSFAAYVSTDEAVSVLTALGMIRGGDSGMELDRAPTRAEALVMLLRLLGLEQEAASYTGTSGLTDVRGTWAEKYIAYAENAGLVRGAGGRFNGDSAASVRDYLTFMLRALGYAEGRDFTWNDSIAFADKIGLTHGEYKPSSPFKREDMALISYTALTLNKAGTDAPLIAALYQAGAVSYAALVSTRLAGYVNSAKAPLSPEEIYERCSSAVFFMEVYESEEAYKSGNSDATASGFFITADGVALASCHAINNMRYATVTTTDGHTYPITGVLGYDTFRDYAVVKVSKTDTNGGSVTRFPYLDVGDSDALSVGNTVYAIGSPRGLSDTLSKGIVSTRSRVIDDPAYPCIQFTASISTGNSGGALINEYGEAIGIVYAMYNNANDLYFAVPVNAVKGVALTGTGRSLPAIADELAAKNAKSVIMASETSLTMKVGEEKDILISSDCPVPLTLQYAMYMTSVIDLNWGRFETKTSIWLHVVALEPGEATIELTFTDGCGNEDFELDIEITVVE